ncbi:MAG TPA: DUF2188 domain-containing protein [Propylenella sp.]|jgi:hypothetical protein
MPKVKRPSPAEEAEIQRGIAADPDTWVPGDAEWAKARPIQQVDLELARGAPREKRGAGAVRQYHVLPRQKGWVVRKIGAGVTELFPSKSDAIEYARDRAKASNVEWVEYRRDGTVRDIHRPSEQRHRRAHG